MTKFYTILEAFFADKKGATAIEYGLIAAGIAVAIAGTVFLFGDDLDAMFVGAQGKLAERAGEL